MQQSSLLALFLVSAVSVSASADNYPRMPDIDVASYRFDLTVSYAEKSVEGKATIVVTRTQARAQSLVSLDFVGDCDSDLLGAPVDCGFSAMA